MYKKRTRVILASLLAATMAASAVTQLAAPLTASAGQVLGESTFDYKILPWHLVAASPARQNFEIKDGELNVQIIVPEGAEKAQWDLQLRHRGLSFRKDHVYEVSFKAKAKRDGIELCSYIGQPNDPFDRYFVLDGNGMGEYSENSMHMGPHMGGQWGSPVKLTTEYQTFSGTFTPTCDLEGMQWVFNYAKDSMGYGGNAQEGDELWFDDMSIVCTTCSECGETCPPGMSIFGETSRLYSGQENNYISVNQLGYYPNLAKIATLGDNQSDPVHGAESIELDGEYTYEIVENKSGDVKYTGKVSKFSKDRDSGENVAKIDFTAFKEPGEYYIRIKGKEWRSFPFRIADDIYLQKDHNMLTDALNYFYQNRSGQDIKSDYITSGKKGELAHAGGHKSDTATVQTEWHNEYLSQEEAHTTYGSSKIDVTGGWYSSENHSKSMTEGGAAVWTLQNMYERAIQTEEGKKKFEDGSGTVVVPETKNKVPDILDECRYELDFMRKMRVAEDEPTWGDYAGLYYHNVQDHKWTGLAVRPWDYIMDYETVRIVKPPTFAATLNFAACAAQAARLWKPYDAEYSGELWESAKEAYAAYKRTWYEAERNENYNTASLYAPSSLFQAGMPLRDTLVEDDAYWAACELYISAKELEDSAAADYLKDLTESKYAFDVCTNVSGGDNMSGEGSYTCFNKDNMTSAGSLALALHKDLLTEAQKDELEKAILAAADSFVKTTEMQGYGIPYKNDSPGYMPWDDPFGYNPVGFEYGSNAMAVYNMIAMAYAYDQTGDAKYMKGVTAGMDYMLGNNPMAFSFITGYGQYSVKNPTHRYWSYDLDKTLPSAPDGVIVGGPSASTMDSYMRSMGFVQNEYDNASEHCYADDIEAWAVNGVALQWNAPLAWVVSFLQDEAPDAPAPKDPDPQETTEPIMTTSTGFVSEVPSDVSKWGDITCDDSVDVADAVLLARFLNQDADAVISDQGIRNANVVSGSLDADDITALLLCIAKQIRYEQFPLAKLPAARG